MAHCTNDLSSQITYFLDMILNCLNATKDFWYGKFSEVSVEVSVEDMDNNPLHYCHLRKCGVRQIPNAGGGKTRDAMITSVTMWRNRWKWLQE
jgi:hypothetical protein